MTETSRLKSLFIPIAVVLALLLLSGVYIGGFTGILPSAGRVHLPAIEKGYFTFAFMKSPELLRTFKTRVTSRAFIEEVLAAKPEYAEVREQFLAHWKPTIVVSGTGRHFMNTPTRTRNIQLKLPEKCQPTLYALRDDIYSALERLMYDLNGQYEGTDKPQQEASATRVTPPQEATDAGKEGNVTEPATPSAPDHPEQPSAFIEVEKTATAIFAALKDGDFEKVSQLLGDSGLGGALVSFRDNNGKRVDFANLSIHAIYAGNQIALVVSAPLPTTTKHPKVIRIILVRKDGKWRGRNVESLSGDSDAADRAFLDRYPDARQTYPNPKQE